MALCPTCNKTSKSDDHKPFCSARCKSIDLGYWLSDSYVIAGEETVAIPEITGNE
ncbi:MAG: DNA gyrase inhibitor YacG [Pseudomonadota bacterium]